MRTHTLPHGCHNAIGSFVQAERAVRSPPATTPKHVHLIWDGASKRATVREVKTRVYVFVREVNESVQVFGLSFCRINDVVL